MMKTWMSLFIGLSLLLLLTACGSADGAQEAAPTVMAAAELPDGGDAAEQSAAGEPAAVEQAAVVEQSVADVPAAAGQVQVADEAVALTADYADALSVQGQLAVGMMQLEATEQAVTAEQAATLLPLWQALQALSLSDTTAEVELTAVVNQIADSMTPEQVAAIANMRLTADQVTAMLENGELGAVGGRGFGGGNGQGGNGQGAGAGMMGGGPGGGLPGGGGPGSLGGLGGGEIDPAMIETRQAEFAANGTAVFQERMLTGVAVRLLEEKMGIVSDAELRRVVMDEAFTAVAQAAGLSVADLQAEVANGNTLTAVVQTRGGDVAALQAQLVTIFAELPDADQLDLVQAAADWLGQ